MGHSGPGWCCWPGFQLHPGEPQVCPGTSIYFMAPWLGRAKGGGAKHRGGGGKSSQGWPVGNHFWRPSEKCFRGGHPREILGVCKGLYKRSGMGGGAPPLFCPTPPFGVLWLGARSWICSPQLPDHPSHTHTHSIRFATQGGTHRLK